MAVKATTKDAYKLFHEGQLALSRVEHNGIRIDVDYLNQAITETEQKIVEGQEKLKQSDEWDVWRKRFGQKASLGSAQQLASVMFEILGHKPKSATRTGKYSTNEEAFMHLRAKVPFIRDYFANKKLEKAVGTYLKGILRETVDGILHPSFNLQLAKTFRSSSDNPNFQNMPIRNPVIGKIIRSCFRARKGRRIVELDFGGIEVTMAACYHFDPTMIDYLEDLSKDMHRDCAGVIFKLDQKDINKKIRNEAKNKFVFPQFYGSFYVDCAKALWNAMTTQDLVLDNGTTLKDHLASKGIKRRGLCDDKRSPLPGSFEKHVKEVEDHFWNARFPIYTAWKKSWFNKYKAKGYFDNLTGFEWHGVFRRNEVINYPVQSVAFHVLLWCLTKIQDECRKLGMRTMIMGQIHDSIIADVPDSEFEQYLTIAKRVMTVDARKRFPWINTTLKVEAEASPVNGTWYEKAKVKD